MRRLLALLLACDPAPETPDDSAAPTASPSLPMPAATNTGARPLPAPSRSVAGPALAGAPPTPPHSPVPKDSPRRPPEGFVDLRVTLPTACFAAGYASADNFTGAPLPGYAAPATWMLAEPAAALARAQDSLATAGLVLLIFDAYRPRRASEAMVAWAERTGQAALMQDGYIARRSGHNHGHTIDLGLARRKRCEPAGWLDMGTPWDTLDERSHTMNATGLARENRLTLLRAMRGAGFREYTKEWWHFSYPLPGTRPRDVPHGAHEPDEAP